MTDFVQNLLGEIAAPIFVLLFIAFLARHQAPARAELDEVKVLRLFSGRSLARQVLDPIALTLLANGGLALVILPVIARLAGSAETWPAAFRNLLTFLPHSLAGATYNYLIWGSLSILIQALASKSIALDHRVFATAGFLGGVVHSVFVTIGHEYVSMFLRGTTEDQLYSLHATALVRLWTPLGLESISAGVLLAYYFEVGKRISWAIELYAMRYKLVVILGALLLIVYPGVRGATGGSFVVKALEWHNVGVVWWGAVFIIIAALAVGTELYDRLLAPRWLHVSSPAPEIAIEPTTEKPSRERRRLSRGRKP